MKIEDNSCIHGDCLEIMRDIDDKKADIILCDLPYGVTQNKKDKQIDLNKLWVEYKRIIKDNGAILLTSQFPFTVDLYLSAKDIFRYDLIWEKTDRPSGFLNANRMPLRSHEIILMFYKKLPTYNPQWTVGQKNHTRGHSRGKKQTNRNYGDFNQDYIEVFTKNKYPRSVIKIPREHPPIHPTQKPIALGQFLTRMYSNKGDLLLDNCFGSASFLIGAMLEDRRYIGIEKDDEHYKNGTKRLQEHIKKFKDQQKQQKIIV